MSSITADNSAAPPLAPAARPRISRRWSRALVIALSLIGVFALVRSAIACCEGQFFLIAALELVGCVVCLILAIGLDRINARLDQAFAASESQRRRIESAEAQLRDSLHKQEDLTQRERALRRELDHRVRNNLAALLGLVRLYRRSGNPGASITQIESKLHAMREVHEMLATADEQDVMLGELVRRLGALIIGDSAAAAVTVRTPDGAIAAPQAAPLAIILQELFTNSFKHGALRAGEAIGRVEVSWRPSDSGFTLTWREHAPLGAAGDAPLPEGLGTALIRGFARSELQGDCEFARTADGLNVELRAGVPLILRPATTFQSSAAAAPLRPLAGAATQVGAVRAREE